MRDSRGAIAAVTPTDWSFLNRKDLTELESLLDLLDLQEKTILKFLENPIAKDKTIRRWENVKVDTKLKSYGFILQEWHDDMSESPETLKPHSRLPFLVVNICKHVTISKSAQKTLDEAAIQIRNENHTDIPHTRPSCERDVGHTLS